MCNTNKGSFIDLEQCNKPCFKKEMDIVRINA